MYKTTQEERLDLVLKLSKNADLFSEHFPGARILEGDGWTAGVSGIPIELFNGALVFKNRNDAVDEVIAAFESANCPGTIKLFGSGLTVAGHLIEKGWVPRSTSPLMMWKADSSLESFALRDGLSVERLPSTDESRKTLWDIFVICYGEAPDLMRDTFMKVFVVHPADYTYALKKDGEIVSIVTAVVQDDYVGIWSMATPPDHQKKGYGGELLKFVMKRHTELGAKDFALVATDAGKVLYDKLGWQTIEHYTSYGIKREEGENPYV
ncbi:NAT_SF domain containing protein [Candidatus Nanopelagicaceae bacterium]